MREYLVNRFPWVTPAWYFVRATLAAFGALCLYMGMFYYGVALEVITSGLFVVSWAFTLCLEAVLLGFTIKAWLINLNTGVGVVKEINPAPTNEFVIKDDAVFYSPDQTLKDLKKQTHTKEGWWAIAKKYNNMDEYKEVRTYCLSQAKKG